MEHAQDLIRPWRRATVAVTAVAVIELIALAGIAIVVFGNPLGDLRETAAAAGTPRQRAAHPLPPKKEALERSEISVMVLNGNGLAGAARAAAEKVSGRGYLVGTVGNATTTTPRTLIMYRPGFAVEGARLARDLRVRVVRPLDGIRPAQLMGAHLVLILGR